MRTTVKGVYRGGKVELAQEPANVPDETEVIVTFVGPDDIDLRERGIDETQADELRARLAAFAEDWDRPEMDAYNNYDEAKGRL